MTRKGEKLQNEIDKTIRNFETTNEFALKVRNLKYEISQLEALKRKNTDPVIARQIVIRLRSKQKSLRIAEEHANRKLKWRIDNLLKETFRKIMEEHL